jgi:hypothetical protein
LVVAPPDEALLFESGEMLVHSGEGSKLKSVRNLFKTRRVAIFVDEPDEVIQDFFLPLG